MNSTMIDLSIRIAKENDIPWMYDSISSNSNIQYNYFEREIKNSKISYIIELNKVPMGSSRVFGFFTAPVIVTYRECTGFPSHANAMLIKVLTLFTTTPISKGRPASGICLPIIS